MPSPCGGMDVRGNVVESPGATPGTVVVPGHRAVANDVSVAAGPSHAIGSDGESNVRQLETRTNFPVHFSSRRRRPLIIYRVCNLFLDFVYPSFKFLPQPTGLLANNTSVLFSAESTKLLVNFRIATFRRGIGQPHPRNRYSLPNDLIGEAPYCSWAAATALMDQSN